MHELLKFEFVEGQLFKALGASFLVSYYTLRRLQHYTAYINTASVFIMLYTHSLLQQRSIHRKCLKVTNQPSTSLFNYNPYELNS